MLTQDATGTLVMFELEAVLSRSDSHRSFGAVGGSQSRTRGFQESRRQRDRVTIGAERRIAGFSRSASDVRDG
jgi:hypothetical protein